MEKQRRGLNRHSVLRDSWRCMDCRSTPLEFEANDNQMSPGVKNNRLLFAQVTENLLFLNQHRGRNVTKERAECEGRSRGTLHPRKPCSQWSYRAQLTEELLHCTHIKTVCAHPHKHTHVHKKQVTTTLGRDICGSLALTAILGVLTIYDYNYQLARS